MTPRQSKTDETERHHQDRRDGQTPRQTRTDIAKTEMERARIYSIFESAFGKESTFLLLRFFLFLSFLRFFSPFLHITSLCHFPSTLLLHPFSQTLTPHCFTSLLHSFPSLIPFHSFHFPVFRCYEATKRVCPSVRPTVRHAF